MIVFERRASTVLFCLLRSHPVEGPFLLPANICPIVPMAFCKAQRPFEFIDIAPDTLCMDHDALVERWSKPHNRPAGLVYVRTYGAIFEASNVFASIKSLSPQALIVDDRCLCPPEFGGTLAPHADVALYSTGYAKYDDIGYGGFGVLSDGITYAPTELAFNGRDLEEMTEQYKNALRTKIGFSYTDSDWLDANTPQDTWAAYRGRVEQGFVRVSEAKAVMNSIYSSRLPPKIQFPSAFQAWRFNIQVQDKAAVLDAIRQEGFFASGHYDSLAGLFGPGKAPIAKMVHHHVINLFNDRYFSPDQAIKLTEFLTDYELLSPGPLFS
jgi:hypothetical protein